MQGTPMVTVSEGEQAMAEVQKPEGMGSKRGAPATKKKPAAKKR
jgi:hypothetical protein